MRKKFLNIYTPITIVGLYSISVYFSILHSIYTYIAFGNKFCADTVFSLTTLQNTRIVYEQNTLLCSLYKYELLLYIKMQAHGVLKKKKRKIGREFMYLQVQCLVVDLPMPLRVLWQTKLYIFTTTTANQNSKSMELKRDFK